MESNKIKKEVCDSVVKVLKDENVDDKTINRFEDIFWKKTQGYVFREREVKEKDLQNIKRCTFRVNDECGHTASCKICSALGGN